MNKILIISGPTAAGKTQLAFRLAKQFDGELISADSRQVYRGMDIGTGKEFPVQVKTQNSKLKIFGYDLVNPDEEWSAAHFVKLADKLIPEIQSRGRLPIIVGGTGLYIANLLNPPETLNIPPDRKLRAELEKPAVAELQDRLKKINQKRFEKMNESDRSNPRRLIRAIEICSVDLSSLAEICSFAVTLRKTQGKPTRCRSGWPRAAASSLRKFANFTNSDMRNPHINGLRVESGITNVLHIALTAPISIVDKRIEDRVRQRIDQGAEEEVRGLVKKYGWDSALKFTIGYKEWRPHIDVSKEETEDRKSCEAGSRSAGQRTMKKEIVKLWTIHEKQYARRQLTWMAKFRPDKLFDISKPDYILDIEACVDRWYYGK
ncbi:hypothetical protein HZB78_02510 [Candidatus Collierbacteria bacterium]|nr:hypothetical protein [Candidatus Collierbacteria bacterium]